MGRESRVLPLNRHHVSEAMNTNAAILEAVRAEVLKHGTQLEAIQAGQELASADIRALKRLRTEHDAFVKFIHLEAAHVYGKIEPLSRGFLGRLRWLLTGR